MCPSNVGSSHATTMDSGDKNCCRSDISVSMKLHSVSLQDDFFWETPSLHHSCFPGQILVGLEQYSWNLSNFNILCIICIVYFLSYCVYRCMHPYYVFLRNSQSSILNSSWRWVNLPRIVNQQYQSTTNPTTSPLVEIWEVRTWWSRARHLTGRIETSCWALEFARTHKPDRRFFCRVLRIFGPNSRNDI